MFLGVNKRQDRNTLDDRQSPDLRNVRPFSEVLGTLGPRPGVKFFNSTAYDDPAVRVMKFFRPGFGYEFAVADDNGAITIVNAPYTPPDQELYDFDIRKALLGSSLSTTLTYPDTSEASTQTFSLSETFTLKTGQRIICSPSALSITFSESAPSLGQIDLTFSIGPIVDGSPDYTVFTTEVRSRDEDGAASLQGANSVSGNNTYTTFTSWFMLDYSGSGVISGLAVKLDATYSNISSSVILNSGISTIYIV